MLGARHEAVLMLLQMSRNNADAVNQSQKRIKIPELDIKLRDTANIVWFIQKKPVESNSLLHQPQIMS